MRLKRRTFREVLADNRGVASSIPEALGGVALKAIVISAIGGTLAAGIAFWASSTASAGASSDFQTSAVLFEKAVKGSDVVIGVNGSRVGLLKDTADGRCEVQTWQNGTRDGKVSLRLDTKTVSGTCTPTTPLLAAASTPDSRELAWEIDAPAFTYSNLGGREIVFNATGTPTLKTGAKPSGVKQADWDDVRPYKVAMSLKSANKDAALVTKKSVSTGYTNVMNVTAAEDDLRYVPAPSDSPIPGPITITSVVRSTTTGTAYAGAREGAAITFSGAVCPTGPTKINVSYVRQSPSVAAAVNTVISAVMTGESRTVHLGSVPNGASGEVSATATCVEGGVAVSDSTGFTQKVPATTLTAKQNAAPEKHDLSWIQVSSLPTQFELRWTVGSKNNELLTTTSALAYQSVNSVGGNLGLTTQYSIVATVDGNTSPAATASLTNPLPKAPATTVTAADGGASWSAISCPAQTVAEYSSRYHHQTGTSTTVSWSAKSDWSTNRTLTGVTTPAYGRTVYEVDSRCVATVSGVISPTSTAPQDAFYVPEAISLSAARSTSVGTVYEGTREGAMAMYSGARCYANTPSTVVVKWQPAAPSGQQIVTAPADTKVRTTAVDQVNLSDVRNGATGSMVAEASCAQVKSGTQTTRSSYTQTLPKPSLTVAEGTSVNQHVLTWGAVSSLPTTFQVAKTAAAGTENAAPAATTALTQTFNYAAGTNYANKTDYSVAAKVGAVTGTSSTESITGAWPATPRATAISYSRTGGGGVYQGGKISWNYSASCPAGTTLQGRALENRTGQSNGTIDTTVRHTTDWATNKTAHDWWPAYSLQGYTYGVGVDTKCISNVTAFESPMAQEQSSNFTTAFATPAAPKYDGYNYRDWRRGSLTGYFETCWGVKPNRCNTTYTPIGLGAASGGKWYQSYTMDFISYCPTGSNLSWSQYYTFNTLNGYFGKADGWQFPENQSSRLIEHRQPVYRCSTPFATSGNSAVGSDVNFTMTRLWW